MNEFTDRSREMFEYSEMSNLDPEATFATLFIKTHLAPDMSMLDLFAILRGLKNDDVGDNFADSTSKLLMTIKLTVADEVSKTKKQITNAVDSRIAAEQRKLEEQKRIAELAKRDYFAKNHEGNKLKVEVLELVNDLELGVLRNLDDRQKMLVDKIRSSFSVDIYLQGWFNPRWVFRHRKELKEFRAVTETVMGRDFELYLELGSSSQAIAYRNFRTSRNL